MSDGRQAAAKRRRWPRWLLLLILLAVAGVIGQNVAMGWFAKRYEATLPRDPVTGLMRGAAPFDIRPISPKGVVLFIHGFSGTPNNFNVLPARVADAGWRAKSLLLPGHGTTPSDTIGVTADNMLDFTRSEIAGLRAEHETVVLLGHSMGGAVATVCAVQEKADGLILAAPFFRVRHYGRYVLPVETWARVMSPMVRWLPSLQKPVNLESSKPHIYSYDWSHRDAVLAAIALSQRAGARETLAAVTCPVLLVHSVGDKVTDFNAAQSAVAAMPAEDKTVVPLTRSDHVIFWDYEAEETAQAVVAFLARLN